MTEKDPVCGMDVDVEDGALTADYGGNKYYFCGRSCQERFKNSPEKFLQAQSSPTKEDLSKWFICPMHPEIRQQGPGHCPICGMSLEPETASLDDAPDPELILMTHRLWVSAALTVPLLLVVMPHMFGVDIAMHVRPIVLGLVELSFATPVVVWGGLPFFRRALDSVVHRSPNMFTLIAIGSGVAWLYSVVGVLAPSIFPMSFRNRMGGVDLYFEAAAVIVTLVLLGQVLELRARTKTGAAIKSLLGLTPTTARQITDEGESDVALDLVHVGMKLRVRPGETVPVDGKLLDGRSTVDESMITGEAIPVAKVSGNSVTAGTLNGTGTFTMRAERVGADTLLSRIVQMVAEAQRSRAPIQSVADKVASYFVPSVVIVSIISFFVWAHFGPPPSMAYAVINAVAVLIIACPCALGLATPMAIMVGMGRGATSGVLVRNADGLERMERVDTLVIDKTGTLTEGKPKVVQIAAYGIDEAELLAVAAGLESGSEHPLSSAIVAAAEGRNVRGIETTEFSSETGKGLVGKQKGEMVAIGNKELLKESGLDVSDAERGTETWRNEGQTVVYVIRNRKLLGSIGIADPIKDSAPAALATLRQLQIRVVMLTGDSKATAAVVADKLGITEFEAEVLPEGKRDAIRKLQAEGRYVAMAGDGINDAPALSQADIGIAMGTGTDVAISSSTFTLVKGDLDGIVRARNLSRATMKNIRQNLFFAFIYNAVGVTIASGIFYPLTGVLLNPMVAAFAMSLSSVSVIGNSLRLAKAQI